MSIDIEKAAHVAKLARIRVDEDELPALAAEFNTILGFIEQLGEVAPTYSAGLRGAGPGQHGGIK